MMPWIERMRLATRPSRSARMIGMPPATLASKSRCRWCLSAVWKSSAPRSASSALFAVMTCLPFCSACWISSKASVVPPISSTMTSRSGLATSLRQSAVTSFSGTPISRARSAPAHGDLVDANFRAGALPQQVLLRGEAAPDAGPDRAEAGQADAKNGRCRAHRSEDLAEVFRRTARCSRARRLTQISTARLRRIKMEESLLKIAPPRIVIPDASIHRRLSRALSQPLHSLALLEFRLVDRAGLRRRLHLQRPLCPAMDPFGKSEESRRARASSGTSVFGAA